MVYIGVPSQLTCFLTRAAEVSSACLQELSAGNLSHSSQSPAADPACWAAADGTQERTVKDAAESVGIPHVEIGSYYLKVPGDIGVKIVTETHSVRNGDSILLTESRLVPEGSCRFILDVHLGKLARYLRLLGLDCWYRGDYEDAEIADLAEKANRIVLTRDIGLLKRKSIRFGYWLRSQISSEQAEEVVRRYRLQMENLAPLSRCPRCNSPLVPVPKNFVYSRLPEKTRIFYEVFFQCLGCSKIYWRGSHYPKLLSLIKTIA